MKEVALLLGELAENAPIQVCDSKHGLLTPEQVMTSLHKILWLCVAELQVSKIKLQTKGLEQYYIANATCSD